MTNFVVTTYSGRSYDELCCNEFYILCYYEARLNGLLYLMLPPVCTTLSQKESQTCVYINRIFMWFTSKQGMLGNRYTKPTHMVVPTLFLSLSGSFTLKKWILKSKHFWAMSQKTKRFIEGGGEVKL